MKYISTTRRWSHKKYSSFDFSAHSVFTFDVFWSSLGTSIFGNSSSAANNAQSRLIPDYLSVSYDYGTN